MNAPDPMTAETADLLLQLGRSAYADCAASGLTQAQWIAIRFFSRANRFSRTISGFAQYHATTRGTASQTVKILVEKGYLVRTPSEKDARSVLFDLTAQARRKLRDDPLEAIAQVAGRLETDERNRMTDSLRSMLADLRQGCRQPDSGICRLCGHLDRGDGDQGARCRLMQEPLAVAEFNELCIRYQPGIR
jgi:DNA-binding MarR family transcriptional regulator